MKAHDIVDKTIFESQPGIVDVTDEMAAKIDIAEHGTLKVMNI